jgi:hypothetical protein
MTGMNDNDIKHYETEKFKNCSMWHIIKLENLFDKEVIRLTGKSWKDFPYNSRRYVYGKDVGLLSYKNAVEGMKHFCKIEKLDIDVGSLDNEVKLLHELIRVKK